ncbi:MAG: hypothetical protein ACXWL2_02125 [Candidatus Chromulinivorax sp.]
MIKNIFLIILCIYCRIIDAEAFIYPVADFDNEQKLLLLYQKSLTEIELWIWDVETQSAIKGISSFSIPANLRILPSKQGFSFIDQGFIKIKEFSKRSAKTLPIYEPIGLFCHMNWIDEESFYFVARQGDFFQIFQSDMQANILQLTYDSCDALYPQKIDSDLFYIKRDNNYDFSIIKKPWNSSSDNTEEIIAFNHNQLCFLHMISDKEGFYLQAPNKKIENDEDCYEFSYNYFYNNEQAWKNKKLFTFLVPAKYITGNSKLYESIEPLLPIYNQKNNKIYFLNWNKNNHEFDLYTFSQENQSISQKINEQNRTYHQKIFKPYPIAHKIFCGFILENIQNQKSIFDFGEVEIPLIIFEEK